MYVCRPEVKGYEVFEEFSKSILEHFKTVKLAVNIVSAQRGDVS